MRRLLSGLKARCRGELGGRFPVQSRAFSAMARNARAEGPPLTSVAHDAAPDGRKKAVRNLRGQRVFSRSGSVVDHARSRDQTGVRRAQRIAGIEKACTTCGTRLFRPREDGSAAPAHEPVPLLD